MPAEIAALAGIALVLGLRHGTDVDHLATIDSLGRSGSGSGARPARWCGVGFSAGHGLTVVGVATALALLGATAEVASWLESSGVLIAVTALLGLGAANMFSAWRHGHRGHGAALGLLRWLAPQLVTAAPGRWRRLSCWECCSPSRSTRSVSRCCSRRLRARRAR